MKRYKKDITTALWENIGKVELVEKVENLHCEHFSCWATTLIMEISVNNRPFSDSKRALL